VGEFKVASAYADFRIDVDDGIDRAKAQIKKRQRDLDASAKIKLDVDVRDAKANLRKEFASERFTIKADADTTLARARLEKLTGEGTFKIKPDVDDSAARRAESKMDGTVSRMAQRANTQFDLLKFTAFTVGMPAAAAAGAGLTVAALGAIPLAVGAITAKLVSGTDAVSSKWGAFADGVVDDAEGIAASIGGTIVDSIGILSAGWDRLTPKLGSLAAAAAPGITELVQGFDELAENAMPGTIRAAQRTGAAVDGLRTLMGQAGAGTSDFFDNLSQGSQAGGRDIVVLGGTVQTLLGRLGQLGANLATNGEQPLRALDVIVDQLSGSLVDMTAKGSGVIGVFQGFGNAGAGLATVLHGVVAAASLLPPGITQVGGSIAATSMIAQKFGIDMGASFEGLGGKIKAAEGATGKFKAGFIGIASGLFSPATLAVTALGIGLDILGQQQERAAKYAAEHRDNVRSLTQAIREDNGVLGEHVSKVNMNALETKNAAANLSLYGRNLGDAKLAIEGNSDAYDRLNYSARAQLAVIAQQAGLNERQTASLKDFGTEALKTGKNYDQMSDALTKGTGLGAAALDSLTDAQRSAVAAVTNGNAAVGEQINSQNLAKQAYYESESALTGLSQAQIIARDATVEHTKATNDAIGGELGYRGAVEATKTAIAQLAEVNKNHKATEDQKAQALLGAENAMHAQVIAAGQAAAANANVTSENQRAMVAAAAMNAETVRLANTWAGPLPASLQAGIAKMSVSEAHAAGLTVAIDNTGAAVYRLPDGRYIRIESSADQQRAKVEALDASIKALHDRDVRVTVTTYYGTEGRGATMNGPWVARSQGGLVGHLAASSGRRYATGADVVAPIQGGLLGALGRSIRDAVPALLAAGEHVTNSADTARNYNELVAINAGQRNYEKYPDTGRPPERQQSMPVQRSAPTVNLGGVTVIGADADEVLAKVSNRMRWAVR
jgi:hypothetical protein